MNFAKPYRGEAVPSPYLSPERGEGYSYGGVVVETERRGVD